MTTHRLALLLAATACVAATCVAAVAECVVAQAKSSPTVVGQKFGDDKSALNNAGYPAVVGTTVGDQPAWKDCVVVNQRDHSRAPSPNSGGSPTQETVVALNCDAAVASATLPGNSVGSPEGRGGRRSRSKSHPRQIARPPAFADQQARTAAQ